MQKCLVYVIGLAPDIASSSVSFSTQTIELIEERVLWAIWKAEKNCREHPACVQSKRCRRTFIRRIHHLFWAKRSCLSDSFSRWVHAWKKIAQSIIWDHKILLLFLERSEVCEQGMLVPAWASPYERNLYKRTNGISRDVWQAASNRYQSKQNRWNGYEPVHRHMWSFWSQWQARLLVAHSYWDIWDLQQL